MIINQYLETLKERIKKQGLTYEEIEQKSGVPKSTIAKFMCGVTTAPKQATLDKLAKVVGMDLYQPVFPNNDVVEALKKVENESSFTIEKYKHSINESVDLLKSLRKGLFVKDVTCAKLSKMSGIPKATIDKILTQKTTVPTQETLKQLCLALNYDAPTDNTYDTEVVDALLAQMNGKPSIKEYKDTITKCISSLEDTLKVLSELKKNM